MAPPRNKRLKFDLCHDLRVFVILSVFLTGVLVQIGCSSAYMLDSTDPYRHVEVLDRDGKYQLEWAVDWEQSRVNFNVTVRTTGYVGFGISKKGKMDGADIVVGGVMPDGKPYFTDRHGVGNKLPEEDSSQDWTLHLAWETHGHTFLSFSRPFDTCDDKDMLIHGDVVALIWAYGEKDNEIEYHHQNRGAFETYLLDPELTPRAVSHRQSRYGNLEDLQGMKVWTISGVYMIPPKETTYICTIHKAPNTGGEKQHIVGFNPILQNDADRTHIHHFLLHRCTPPEGQDSYNVFHKHINTRGEECYILANPIGRIPTQYCREVVHVFAVGGKAVFFPEHVGIPLSETPNEYYMLQMHYDNPKEFTGVEVRYSLEIYYGEVRKHDAGVLTIGGLTLASPSVMVPPHSLDYVIYGHCGGGCTSKMFPEEGIHVFAVNLHTHLAGRGVRLLHIRDNKELKWISYDNNYNFNYQQNRILWEETRVLPGDILINRCVYENTDRNGSVTIGGFSTLQEMCNGFLWYYNKIPNHGICRSEIRHDIYRSFLDIWNTTWSSSRIENVVTSPSHNTGLTVSEVGNYRVEWNLATRKELQAYHRYLPQISQCPVLVEQGRQSPRFPGLESYLPARRVPVRRSQNPVLASFEKEILDQDSEFVSIYPSEIEEWELGRECPEKKK